jgi:hypothetical protein
MDSSSGSSGVTPADCIWRRSPSTCTCKRSTTCRSASASVTARTSLRCSACMRSRVRSSDAAWATHICERVVRRRGGVATMHSPVR